MRSYVVDTIFRLMNGVKEQVYYSPVLDQLRVVRTNIKCISFSVVGEDIVWWYIGLL